MTKKWFLTQVDTIIDLEKMEAFRIVYLHQDEIYKVYAEEGCRNHTLALYGNERQAKAYLIQVFNALNDQCEDKLDMILDSHKCD